MMSQGHDNPNSCVLDLDGEAIVCGDAVVDQTRIQLKDVDVQTDLMMMTMVEVATQAQISPCSVQRAIQASITMTTDHTQTNIVVVASKQQQTVLRHMTMRVHEKSQQTDDTALNTSLNLSLTQLQQYGGSGVGSGREVVKMDGNRNVMKNGNNAPPQGNWDRNAGPPSLPCMMMKKPRSAALDWMPQTKQYNKGGLYDQMTPQSNVTNQQWRPPPQGRVTPLMDQPLHFTGARLGGSQQGQGSKPQQGHGSSSSQVQSSTACHGASSTADYFHIPMIEEMTQTDTTDLDNQSTQCPEVLYNIDQWGQLVLQESLKQLSPSPGVVTESNATGGGGTQAIPAVNAGVSPYGGTAATAYGGSMYGGMLPQQQQMYYGAGMMQGLGATGGTVMQQQGAVSSQIQQPASSSYMPYQMSRNSSVIIRNPENLPKAFRK